MNEQQNDTSQLVNKTNMHPSMQNHPRQPAPKCWVYHPTHDKQCVSKAEAEELLADGWYDTPANFPTGDALEDSKKKAAIRASREKMERDLKAQIELEKEFEENEEKVEPAVKVEVEKPVKTEESSGLPADLGSLIKDELIAFANSKGIEVDPTQKKAEILKSIEDAVGA